jgi:2-(1,2-epoxy-1,2-dihydrophenyl)acetyl-CoA isomerase
MSYQSIILEKADGVATLTLNRPETLNAWNEVMEVESWNALQELRKDDDTRVLIVTGAGKGFSSGADLSPSTVNSAERNFGNGMVGRSMKGRIGVWDVCVAIHNFPKPTIAAVNGVAAGAGTSVAMACDIRIASDKARFSQIFVKRGLVPDSAATYFLPRLVGLSKAYELVFTAQIIDAAEAGRIGLFSRVVPHEDLAKVTRELALNIASNPPISISLAKMALRRSLSAASVEEQLELENALQEICFTTEDFKEGVLSFVQKRAPVYTGR